MQNDNNGSIMGTAYRVIKSRLFLLVLGAVIALLATPKTRRPSQAWMRRQWESATARLRRQKREATRWQSYERGKARGVLYDLRSRFANQGLSEKVDDDIVTDRIRTELGESRRTWHLPRLNIDTFDGVVTLRGHLQNEIDVHAAESVCRSVPGVREVVSKMTVARPAQRKAAEG